MFFIQHRKLYVALAALVLIALTNVYITRIFPLKWSPQLSDAPFNSESADNFKSSDSGPDTLQDHILQAADASKDRSNAQFVIGTTDSSPETTTADAVSFTEVYEIAEQQHSNGKLPNDNVRFKRILFWNEVLVLYSHSYSLMLFKLTESGLLSIRIPIIKTTPEFLFSSE